MAERQHKDRSNPTGHGPYDAEENLPYLRQGTGNEKRKELLDRADGALDDIDSVLAESEAQTGHGEKRRASRATQSERSAVGNAVGESSWEDKTEDDGGSQKRGLLVGWKRKAAAAGGGVLGIGMIMGILGLSTGPLSVLHFAEFLQGAHFSGSDAFADFRASELIRYGRTFRNPEQRNLGYFGNKIANYYTVRLRDAGVEYGYTSGRISDVTIEENSRTRRAIDLLEEEGFSRTTSTVDDKTVHTYSLAGEDGFESAARRRLAINTTVGVIGNNGDASALTSRLMKGRGGVRFGVANIPRAADEAFFDYLRKIREDTANYIREGRNTDLSARASDVGDAADGEDPAARTQTDDAAAAAQDIIEEPGNQTPTVEAPRLRTRILQGGALLGGFAGLVCGLNELGDEIGTIQTSNIVKPLIRNGMSVVTLGAQIRFGGNINSDQIGAIAKDFYDEANKTSWTDGASVRAQMGKTGGVPMDESAIPGKDKPLFFQTLDDFLSQIEGSAEVCDAVQSRVGQIILTVADYSTGPFSALVGDLGTRLLTDAFLDDFIRWVTGDQIDTNVQGAMFGNFADSGTFLANNDRMFSLGGRELTTEEVVQLNEVQEQDERYELRQMSFFARMFDLKQPKSLASKTFFESSSLTSSTSLVSGLTRAPTGVFGALTSNFANIFSPRASAARIPYDYGVPEIGFSDSELSSDVAKEDPYVNADIVEGDLDRLNDVYGECFSTTIDADSGSIETTNVTQYIGRDREKCDNSGNEELLRYRFYLADMSIAQGLVCLSGEDEATCSNLGFENEAADTNTAQLPDGVVTAEDIEDIPPWLAPGAGCHTSIASRVREMFEAADADGVRLTGSCWRSSERQIELRRLHCGLTDYDIYEKPSGQCVPPTAIPGTSNHERGLAIDFDNCSSRSTACFIWLSANAATYGMQNLPSEPWHWSVDGG